MLCAIDDESRRVEKEANDDDHSLRQNACKEEKPNDDDIHDVSRFNGLLIVGKREGVMPKEKFCEMMRTCNLMQRALLLEIIHRIHAVDEDEEAPFRYSSQAPRVAARRTC